MQRVSSELTQFRGSHYDFGRFQGKYIKRSKLLENRTDQWKLRVPRFEIDEREAKQAFDRFAPKVWEELLGLQDELELTLAETLLHFGHFRVNNPVSGCSILTGDNFLVRNYDYHPMTYDGRFNVFQPDEGYAVIGPVSRVTGRMDGMNEKGLAMGYNFINRRRPGDGFVCQMIGRMILETRVIEATPRDIQVRESNICTNHFELLQHENRYHLDDSTRRMMEIKMYQHIVQDAESAFRLMNDSDKGVFSELYKSWAGTIHTAAYFPETLETWFALGGDRDPVIFDFQTWLDGEDFDLHALDGEIATDIEFANTVQLWR